MTQHTILFSHSLPGVDVQLRIILGESWEVARQLCTRSRPPQFNCNISDDVLVRAKVDHLRVVLVEVLLNSLRYSAGDGETVVVDVRGRRAGVEGRCLELSLSDHDRAAVFPGGHARRARSR